MKKLGLMLSLLIFILSFADVVAPRIVLAAPPQCFIKSQTDVNLGMFGSIPVTTKIVGPVPCEGRPGEGVLNIPNFHEINKAETGEDLQDGRVYYIVANQPGIDYFDAESQPAQDLVSHATALPTSTGSSGGSAGGSSAGSGGTSSGGTTAATGSAPSTPVTNNPKNAAACDYSKPLTDEEKKAGCVERSPGFEQIDSSCISGDQGKNCSITGRLQVIADFLSAGVGIIIVIMLIIGGIQYTTAGGDPGKVAAAKNRILNAIYALIAFFFLYSFLQWIIPGGIF